MNVNTYDATPAFDVIVNFRSTKHEDPYPHVYMGEIYLWVYTSADRPGWAISLDADVPPIPAIRECRQEPRTRVR